MGSTCTKIVRILGQLMDSADSRYSIFRKPNTEPRTSLTAPGKPDTANASSVFWKPEPRAVAMTMVNRVGGMAWMTPSMRMKMLSKVPS